MKIMVQVCGKCGSQDTQINVGDGLVECESCGDVMNEKDILYKLEGGA